MSAVGRWAPTAAAVSAGAVFLLGVELTAGDLWRIGATVGLVVVLGAIARRAGLTLDDLGLARDRVGAGLGWGLAVSAAVAVALALGSVLPAVRDLFTDDRYADLDGGALVVEGLVRVPILTALVEEYVFRGVLLALLLTRLRTTPAVAVSSALFGLWHVFAAASFADANAGVPGSGWVATLGVGVVTVAATGVAGVVLCWLRLRSGSLVAPWLVHAVTNGTALVLAAA